MTDRYEMPHARADECPHAGLRKACRPCRDRFERTPITPDERAEWRALADAATPGPWEASIDDLTDEINVVHDQEFRAWVAHTGMPGGPYAQETAEFIAASRTAVPRLLDALDTAEAEVTRLLAERTAAHADDATCASCTHEYVADTEKRAEDAEAKAERQRDRLRAREEQVRRLRAEVTRLHALVADLRTAPVWDEDTVTEAVARALFQRAYPGSAAWDNLPVDEFGKEVWRESARGLLAVVLEHLPVRPDREAVRLAQHRALMPQAMSILAAVGGTQSTTGHALPPTSSCGTAPTDSTRREPTVADEYTPTTEQVRETYAALCKTDAADVEFDRWLAAHDRETAARAWEEAVDCLSRHWEDVIPAAIADLERRNPYREEDRRG